jgi:putative ABC transport system permease protein
MSVFERTQEIGVMKAIGASRMNVFRLIWTETILVCAFGGILGNALAFLGSGVIEHIIKKILPYAPSGQLVLIGPGLLIGAFLGAIVLGIVSGFYPAWRASSMRPVEAIRRGE